MNNEKLEAIKQASLENLNVLFDEMENDIEAAIIATTEQAEADGKESVKITLSHSIIIDLSKNTQDDKLSVSVKHTANICGQIADPNQPELGL